MDLVSSSFPIRPKLRICPTLGAFSRGCAASAFRSAFWIASVRAYCKFHISIQLHTVPSVKVETNLFLVVEAFIVVF